MRDLDVLVGEYHSLRRDVRKFVTPFWCSALMGPPIHRDSLEQAVSGPAKSHPFGNAAQEFTPSIARPTTAESNERLLPHVLVTLAEILSVGQDRPLEAFPPRVPKPRR